MAKINILPSKIFSRIAAGEVVERPCSVVKELVENSIDAGATEIEIYVEKGGKQLIRVVDNGCGIEREDLPSAFLPHATSKVASSEDLENIKTLGFRGEAIASIAAVSKMSITSQTENGKCYRLACDGGELGNIIETYGQKGTDISVEALFYHTPVRLAFLKSDKVEETEITNFVSRFILCRSDISFTYYVEGKKVLQSFGDGDEAALVNVYGASTLSECFCVDAQKHGLHIYGYIGNQNFYKANRSYQSVFLNGRYIINPTVSAAMSGAYSNYLMKRQYPFYVLHIDMPTELVDVNVHPNKADVRFVDNSTVYGCVYSVVSSILAGETRAFEYIVKTPTNTPYEGGADVVTTAPMPKSAPAADSSSYRESAQAEAAATVRIPEFASLTYEQAKKTLEESAPAFTAKKKGIELPFLLHDEVSKERLTETLKEKEWEPCGAHFETGIPVVPEQIAKGAAGLKNKYPDLFADNPTFLEEADKADTFALNKQFLEEAARREEEQERIDVSNCTYAGKLFNTYLMFEMKNSVYFIDQHAAHERLIFDRLKEKMENRKIVRQPMLLPYELQLNAFEGTFIREQLSRIEDMGFTITETAENRFEVSEVPSDLQRMDMASFFHDILSNVSNFRAIKLDTLLRDKLASSACKAAVKGGMDLTKEEIDALFKMMDGNMGLKCPHGRPVVVRMKRTELEKMFKRLV